MIKKNWFTQNAQQLTQIFGSASMIGTVCWVGMNITASDISSKTNTTIAFSLMSFLSVSLISGYYLYGYQKGQWAGLAELLHLTIRCKKLENHIEALQLQLTQVRLMQTETIHHPSPETSTNGFDSDNEYEILSENSNREDSLGHLKFA